MLSAAMIAAIQKATAAAGDDTTVNRQAVAVKANWSRADFSRVQRYLDEQYWSKPVYEVGFPMKQVLGSPYKLANGSELIWQTMGYKAIVRAMDPETVSGKGVFVVAFAVLTGKE